MGDQPAGCAESAIGCAAPGYGYSGVSEHVRSRSRRRVQAPAAMTADMARRIDEALRSLAPTWVRTGVRTIDMRALDGMWPSERAAVAGAMDRRQAEFATGRALLRQLIGDDVEIRVGSDRRPLLPPGVTGSLAHDQEIAVAATTTRSTCCALGVDIEPLAVFSRDEARMILRPEERHLDAHLDFVLKEAVYKAWSSLGGQMLDHHEVVVDVDESGRDFTAIVGSVPATFSGSYVVTENRHLALVVVEETRPPILPDVPDRT